MRHKHNTACLVPMNTLIIDADGGCRLCSQHEINIGSICDMPDIGSTWKTALRAKLLWHDADVDLIWTGIDSSTVREQQANGRWPDRCQVCKTAEIRGMRSPRQDANAKNPELLANGIIEPKIRMLTLNAADHRIRHFMGDWNLSRPLRWERQIASWCASLSPDDTNYLPIPTWIESMFYEFKLHLVNPDSYLEELSSRDTWTISSKAMDNIAAISGDIMQLTLSGGDPMIGDSMAGPLDVLLANGRHDCPLQVNTMLSDCDDAILARLTSFDDCQVNVTIDGHGSIDEWLRYQSQWHMTTAAMDKLLSSPQLHIKVYTHVSAVNAMQLPDLLSWLRNVSERHQRLVTWTPIICHVPHELRLNIIPEEQRLDLAARLRSLKDAQGNQYPLYCWDGIDAVNKMLTAATPTDTNRGLRLRELLDWQQAVRRNTLVRKWLGYGEDPDWQAIFPDLDACLPREG